VTSAALLTRGVGLRAERSSKTVACGDISDPRAASAIPVSRDAISSCLTWVIQSTVSKYEARLESSVLRPEQRVNNCGLGIHNIDDPPRTTAVT
jgi:hypothetical protein